MQARVATSSQHKYTKRTILGKLGVLLFLAMVDALHSRIRASFKPTSAVTMGSMSDRPLQCRTLSIVRRMNNHWKKIKSMDGNASSRRTLGWNWTTLVSVLFIPCWSSKPKLKASLYNQMQCRTIVYSSGNYLITVLIIENMTTTVLVWRYDSLKVRFATIPQK